MTRTSLSQEALKDAKAVDVTSTPIEFNSLIYTTIDKPENDEMYNEILEAVKTKKRGTRVKSGKGRRVYKMKHDPSPVFPVTKKSVETYTWDEIAEEQSKDRMNTFSSSVMDTIRSGGLEDGNDEYLGATSSSFGQSRVDRPDSRASGRSRGGGDATARTRTSATELTARTLGTGMSSGRPSSRARVEETLRMIKEAGRDKDVIKDVLERTSRVGIVDPQSMKEVGRQLRSVSPMRLSEEEIFVLSEAAYGSQKKNGGRRPPAFGRRSRQAHN